MEKENHSAEKKPMREYTPWDYVKPGIAIAAFAVGLIFVLFKFDAVSKVGRRDVQQFRQIFLRIVFLHPRFPQRRAQSPAVKHGSLSAPFHDSIKSVMPLEN